MEIGAFKGGLTVPVDMKLVLPAYDYCLKCSHTFNLLNARGPSAWRSAAASSAGSGNWPACAPRGYLKQRQEMGFPLLKK